MAVTQNWDWKKFNPRVRQTDKREREGLVIKGRKMVEKNLFELGTSSLVCVPEVNLDRTFKKINHIFPPNSPLERFFNDRSHRAFIRGLDKAIEDTQLWALELWELKEKASDDELCEAERKKAEEKFTEMVGNDSEEEDEEDEVNVKIEKTNQADIFNDN